MSEWISVEERYPPPKSWVIVLADRELGDYWDRKDRPRYGTYAAQLRYFENDGTPSWQQWETPDGGPIRSRELHMITHWQPFPEPPPETSHG